MTSAKRAAEAAPECVHVLADSERNILANLPPIQADPMAERAFAYQLAAIVFGKPIGPVVERKRHRLVRRVMP